MGFVAIGVIAFFLIFYLNLSCKNPISDNFEPGIKNTNNCPYSLRRMVLSPDLRIKAK